MRQYQGILVDGRYAESCRAARRGVTDRLTDPYLTDHDRWVLSQFARFLDGTAPGPDPRVVRAALPHPLSARVRRSTL